MAAKIAELEKKLMLLQGAGQLLEAEKVTLVDACKKGWFLFSEAQKKLEIAEKALVMVTHCEGVQANEVAREALAAIREGKG